MISTSDTCMGMGRLPRGGNGVLEDHAGILHWKIFRGISVRPLSAKTGGGFAREVPGPSVMLFCPFWVKHKKGQEEKVFLVLFLYMPPPTLHTWALLCTQDELGQLPKVHGCHSVKLEVSCHGQVGLVVWCKRQRKRAATCRRR